MSLMDSIRSWFSLTSGFDPPQTRAVPDASVAGFIARIQGSRTQTWRIASTDEALGVPAIFSAVTLISNAMGSLSLRAFQRGVELPDEERPRIIIRPNPFSIPRDFFRDTAYSMAVYGEAWWWVAARDFDGLPLSLIPVNPREVIVTENPDDLRFPVIEWRDRKMSNADMKQITYLRDPGALRGFGPLQKCGAAVSVAVEAQEFAANFYADGGVPSIGIKLAYPISGDKDLTDEEAESEADKLRAQWMSKPHNTPRVYGPDIEQIDEFSKSSEGAQMLEARSYNAIEAAQMFTMPAPMIEAAVAGGSLTYQNIPDLYDSFARRCLAPNYAEPIEQTMSDLLTRQVVSRFNMEALLRVDLKTRWEVYEIAAKVIGSEEAATIARQREGLQPGDVEYAPVPLSVPAAIPSSLPIQGRSAAEVRCRCGTLLAELASPPYRLRCRKCKQVTEEVPLTALSAVPVAPVAPQVNIAFPPGFVRIDNHQPDVRVEPQITITPPDVTVHTPEVRVDVQPAQVNVTTPPVTIEPAQITVNTPDVKVENHPPSVVVHPATEVRMTPEPVSPAGGALVRDKAGRVIGWTNVDAA